eukprot:SAG31_NODE_3049_length_4745_cov_3.873870_4_plen_295_part_00
MKQANELHITEQTRAREHEQMVNQIKRVDRWLDECCRPATVEIAALTNIRKSFTAEAVVQLEANNPELVQQMLVFTTPMFSIRADGSVDTPAFIPDLFWRAKQAALTQVFENPWVCYPSAASVIIAVSDMLAVNAQPFCREAPGAILDIVESDPTGDLSHSFRSYVTSTLAPQVRRINAVLTAHAATLEFPPKSWYREKFPENAWELTNTNLFWYTWNAYTASLDSVLAEWSTGVFNRVHPVIPGPYGGLYHTLVWSRSCAEVKSAELVGMTAKADLDMSIWLSGGADGEEESD